MLEIIKTNIGWIRDMSWIIFTCVATVTTILTYIRAKETILQPVRAEVIKRQTEIMAKILEFIDSQNLQQRFRFWF